MEYFGAFDLIHVVDSYYFIMLSLMRWTVKVYPKNNWVLIIPLYYALNHYLPKILDFFIYKPKIPSELWKIYLFIKVRDIMLLWYLQDLTVWPGAEIVRDGSSYLSCHLHRECNEAACENYLITFSSGNALWLLFNFLNYLMKSMYLHVVSRES